MKTLRDYIKQLTESTMDPETQNMLNVAKAKYPDANNDDFGALATLVRKANKHSMSDIKTLGAENDAEEAEKAAKKSSIASFADLNSFASFASFESFSYFNSSVDLSKFR
jgi:hypothetical protein